MEYLQENEAIDPGLYQMHKRELEDKIRKTTASPAEDTNRAKSLSVSTKCSPNKPE